VPPPASGSAAAPGTLASEAWYVAPPSVGATPWQVGAAGFARAEVQNPGTRDASVQQGTAAVARAVANATGRAEATLSAQWRIDVVINPLQLPLVGPGLYEQLMTTLACPRGVVLFATDCSGPERGFSFLHLTQGAFQVTPGQPTGRASFEETATLASRSNSVTLQGGASFSADRPAGSLGITWSGGWSDADAATMPLHDGTTARLFPAGDPRNDLADPFGALSGVRLEALRPLLVSSGFQVGAPYYYAGEPLPFARFTFDLEQVARAGWAFSYGFGTVTANFDDTAVTRLLGIEGLTLTGADGEPVPLAGLLQVHVQPLSPVPEPASALLLALGAGLLWARAQRRSAGRVGGRRSGRHIGPSMRLSLALGSALAATAAAAQPAPPPGWGPAQVTLQGITFDGSTRSATGTLASATDRVEIPSVAVYVDEDLGSAYTWREAVAWARADSGALRSRSYAAAGQVFYDGFDFGAIRGGSFADASAQLQDRLWVPASGYATLELVMSGHIDGSSAGPAAGWPNWSAAWNSEGTMAWRLGTMSSDVEATVRRAVGFGATDGVPYMNPSTYIGVSDTVGLVTGWQLLDLDYGVRHPGSLAVRLRFNVTAGSNRFDLGLFSSTYCHAFAGGLGMLTCQAQSNLSNSLHAGSLALFNPDGTAMAGEVFSASGYDWRQPVSVVPEPASALMAFVGMALLMAARQRSSARAWALPVLL
ncbi:MAG: PEP-CTERM sorting domain-containing protein, partial [Rubrivivax sp.]